MEVEKTNIFDSIYFVDGTNDLFKKIKSIPLLTEDEERQLLIKMYNGDNDAKDELIIRNLRLVASIASKYTNNKVSFLDLFQEGVLGLIDALNNFDISLNCKFSSYSVFYIKKNILLTFKDNSYVIRLPRYIHDKIKEYKLLEADYIRKNNVTPPSEEIIKLMGVTQETAEILKRCQADPNLACSLNDEMIQTITNKDVGQRTFEEEIELKELKTIIEQLFIKCGLDEKEILILKLRFGFDRDAMLLKEVQEILNISKERVRQLELKAINKIRRSGHIKEFAIYMDNCEKCLQNLTMFNDAYIKSKDFKTFVVDEQTGQLKQKCIKKQI